MLEEYLLVLNLCLKLPNFGLQGFTFNSLYVKLTLQCFYLEIFFKGYLINCLLKAVSLLIEIF